ncbi:MAG: type II toxin-antitoxin system VapC family toxin [Chloroflexi bacterium]|nr:type II toxin-antitoxin system VapC family toxin [Chloroflexota bacterium]
MILIDSNIPMYLVGGDHPNRALARDAVQRLAVDGEVRVTDAEVLQEILHRYLSIHRADAVDPAMRVLLNLVREVFPIEREDVMLAAEIARGARLSARDAIHVAVMRRRGITRILSFDRGLDAVEGIDRLPR